MSIRKLLHILLVIIFLLNFIGCAGTNENAKLPLTPRALKFAKTKAEGSSMFIADIKSAARINDETISICIELKKSGTSEPLLYTVTLPLKDLFNGIIRPGRIELGDSEYSIISPIANYWFPIKKAKRGCKGLNGSTNHLESKIQLEEIFLTYYELDQLRNNPPKLHTDLCATFKKYRALRSAKDVIFVLKAMEAKKSFDESKPMNILLAYCPLNLTEKDAPPIVLEGGYESSKAYYALVPAALVADVVIIIFLIVGAIFFVLEGP